VFHLTAKHATKSMYEERYAWLCTNIKPRQGGRIHLKVYHTLK